jgi:phosphoserine phosphatase RsbU/P
MSRDGGRGEATVALSPDTRRRLGEVAVELLERSHELEPGDLIGVLVEQAVVVGLDNLRIYLIDKSQTVLVAADDPSEHVPVVGTVLGDTYSHQRAHTSAIAGATRVNVALVDGADRLGVVTATSTLPPDEVIAVARTYAALAADVLVSKNEYGDELERLRRVEPMSLAAEMRWSLLPPLTFRSPRVSIAGILFPCYTVAGDAFDYAINGDIAHLAVFDAVGHGLEAARVANLTIAAYRHGRRYSMSLRDTARVIDEALAEQFRAETFVTALLAELDLARGTMQWINAGHPRPFVLRDGKTRELVTDPIPPLGLGLVRDDTPVHDTRLQRGDTVLLFSDGVTEARSERGEFFGEDGLPDHLVRSTANDLLEPETLRRLVRRLLEFQDGPLRDDATLLLVNWRGDSG